MKPFPELHPAGQVHSWKSKVSAAASSLGEETL